MLPARYLRTSRQQVGGVLRHTRTRRHGAGKKQTVSKNTSNAASNDSAKQIVCDMFCLFFCFFSIRFVDVDARMCARRWCVRVLFEFFEEKSQFGISIVQLRSAQPLTCCRILLKYSPLSCYRRITVDMQTKAIIRFVKYSYPRYFSK